MPGKLECPICSKKYATEAAEGVKESDRMWDEDEVLAHKINHIESGKVKRVVATIMEITEDQRKEVLDFIQKYLT